MKKEYVMGNGAIALGALSAGVNLVTGYPGTPSSEILENIQKYSDGSVHIEWSVNEKSAMEVAARASYSGTYIGYDETGRAKCCLGSAYVSCVCRG